MDEVIPFLPSVVTDVHSGYYFAALFCASLLIRQIPRLQKAYFYVVSAIVVNCAFEYAVHSDWLPAPSVASIGGSDRLLLATRLSFLGFAAASLCLSALLTSSATTQKASASTVDHRTVASGRTDGGEYKIRVYRGSGSSNQPSPSPQPTNQYANELRTLATRDAKLAVDSAAFADWMDATQFRDLQPFRKQFHFPYVDAERPERGVSTYLCGNSLGLQPVTAATLIGEELQKWRERGVRGHFETSRPWFAIEDAVTAESARLVGAAPEEVAVMNTLTTNLHLLLVAFYRPTTQRFKILIEENPFPSDMYAVISQIRWHGLDPEEALVMVGPRAGEDTIREQDIIDAIEREGASLAVVMLSGVQFLTGQAFDMRAITAAAHSIGAYAGFDLAHAAGNLPLRLHEWDVDFACWCTYKYLNSGPGNIAALFVHERHAHNADLRKFEGWWGNRRANRFKMKTRIDAIPGAGGFQLSNPPVICIAALYASLAIFDEATMPRLRAKSLVLTSYLEMLLDIVCKDDVSIITPRDPERRGCQLSIRVCAPATTVHDMLESSGFVCDKREPDVIRVSPTPLYNSFADVHKFVHRLRDVLSECKAAAKPANKKAQ